MSVRAHTCRWKHPSQLAGPLALSLGIAAIVFFPYLTVTLRHRQALHVQGVGILLVVLCMLVVGALRRGQWNVRLHGIKVPLAGLGLWTAATLAGGINGVLHGNDRTLVAGQLLSLGLLPLGALAGFGLSQAGAWRWFRCGLVGATTAAALLHLGFWVRSLWSGAVFDRLLFHNKVSPIGVALLALLTALSLAVGGRRRQRVVGVLCATVLVLLIFGAAVRSLWLVTVPAVAVLAVVTAVRAGLPAKPFLGAAAAVVGCILVVWGLAFWWLRPERQNLLSGSGIAAPPRAAPSSVEVVPAPAEQGGFAFSWEPRATRSIPLGQVFLGEGGVYRLRAWLRGSGAGGARIALHCKVPWGGYCGSGFVTSRPTGAWRRGETVFLLPAGSAMCHLGLEVGDDATGAWLARPVSLERLGDASFLPLLALQFDAMWARTGGVLADLGAGRGIQDPAIADRLAESAAVLAAFRDAGPTEKLLGHGLGATFRFSTEILDPNDEWQTLDSQNYIHNFFLFLLFKTGLLGAAAVVIALAGWIGWTARNASLLLPSAEGIFLVAAAASWAAYLVWSVACPEILDFRVAPLWGLLLAASTEASARGMAEHG